MSAVNEYPWLVVVGWVNNLGSHESKAKTEVNNKQNKVGRTKVNQVNNKGGEDIWRMWLLLLFIEAFGFNAAANMNQGGVSETNQATNLFR